MRNWREIQKINLVVYFISLLSLTYVIDPNKNVCPFKNQLSKVATFGESDHSINHLDFVTPFDWLWMIMADVWQFSNGFWFYFILFESIPQPWNWRRCRCWAAGRQSCRVTFPRRHSILFTSSYGTRTTRISPFTSKLQSQIQFNLLKYFNVTLSNSTDSMLIKLQ